MRLTTKLTAAASIGIALVLSVHAWLRVERERELFDEDLRRDHATLGDALAEAAELIAADEGYDASVRALEELDQRRGHVQIRWVPGSSPSERVSDVVRRDAVSYLRTRVPVRIEDGSAHIELIESLEATDRFVQQTILRTAWVALASLLVCALAVHLAGRSIVDRPLAAIMDRIRRIGEGDWSVPAGERRGDEMGVLATELDAMCGRLVELQLAEAAQSEARESALTQLRHAGRLATLGQLAAGVAHELGTPLNIVSARAGMIVSGESSPEEAVDDARAIRAQSERMARIIRQLLDFARRRPPERASVDLRAVAGRALAMLGSEARKRGVELRLADGPPTVADVDEGQMEQVLTNLIMNGIQAQPEGGRVELDLTQTAEATRVTVSDAGSGIPEADRARVFEPFVTTKPVGEGTGLGLSVVLGLVEDHGGSVEIDDAPGGGARFVITLPGGVDG